MKLGIVVLAALVASAPVSAQTAVPPAVPAPAGTDTPAPWSKTFTSNAGFTYTYPSEWEEVDAKPIMPAAKMHAEDSASSDVERKAAGCTQIPLLLRHGVPRSVIVVVVMPYACLDNQMKQSDLVGVASGVAAGLQKSYTITDPQYAAYKIGKIEFWAERAKGSPKARPEITQTLETTCGMLKSALVCWMGFASQDEDLRVFESGTTSIADGKPSPLIPADLFEAKKPK